MAPVFKQTLRCLFLAAALAATSGIGSSIAAEEACYADCSGGLTPLNDQGPARGEAAPDFSASLVDPRTGLTTPRSLDSLLESRPIVLAFGSYT